MTVSLKKKVSDQLLNSFPSSSFNIIFIDGDNIQDKKTLLKEFSEKLKFPGYFGFNWDAFSDCMTDLSWLKPENGISIIYKNPHNFRSHYPEDWKIANEILLDAIDYWDEQDKIMIITFL